MIIVSGSVLALALMMHHPTRHDATLNPVVHGALGVLLPVVLVGFVGLAGRLGWSLARVQAAAIAHALAVLLLLEAALVNGFVVPALARHAHDGPADAGAWSVAFELCHEANRVLAEAGTLALAAATVLWATALPRRGRGAVVVAGLGLVAGGGTAVLVVAGPPQLDLRGMTAVFGAQALWGLAVGVWLLVPSPGS